MALIIQLRQLCAESAHRSREPGQPPLPRTPVRPTLAHTPAALPCEQVAASEVPGLPCRAWPGLKSREHASGPKRGREHTRGGQEVAGPCPPGLPGREHADKMKAPPSQSCPKHPRLCPWYHTAHPASFRSPEPAPSHRKQASPKQVIKEIIDSWRPRDAAGPG